MPGLLVIIAYLQYDVVVTLAVRAATVYAVTPSCHCRETGEKQLSSG